MSYNLKIHNLISSDSSPYRSYVQNRCVFSNQHKSKGKKKLPIGQNDKQV
jgi:hypothetical protein